MVLVTLAVVRLETPMQCALKEGFQQMTSSPLMEIHALFCYRDVFT
jgi:hypothetical protein